MTIVRSCEDPGSRVRPMLLFRLPNMAFSLLSCRSLAATPATPAVAGYGQVTQSWPLRIECASTTLVCAMFLRIVPTLYTGSEANTVRSRRH
jgi:hypothetical protein